MKGYSLAGHNINGFDKPYLIKRYIINSIKVPVILNSIGVKPWELNDVDTMQKWKMDGWGVTSLEVISAALGVKCKTTELNGGNMYRYDIKDIDWEELRMYCEEDTRASYEIYKKIKTYL
jgi:DNA polymerase elongation subunit (family B)